MAGSSQKLTDSYLWQYEPQQDVLDASIKGEHWKRYAADVAHGRVRVQSFVRSVRGGNTGLATPLTSIMNFFNVDTHGQGFPVDFVLDMVDPTQTIIGQGYIVRSQLHVVRDGILTDEFEIEVDGQPTFVN